MPPDLEVLRREVTDEEWQRAGRMNPVSRRAEWLAWRAIVRERLGRDVSITYDPVGAPQVDVGHIGVSHTKDWVAVVWSSERRCAVDIESASRDVSHVSSRFVSKEEHRLSDTSNPLFTISVWCAKEALYKYAGEPGLDLLNDIRIVSSDLAAGKMIGSVGNIPLLVVVELHFRDGLVIAAIP